MSTVVVGRLVGILAIVLVGYVAARVKLFGTEDSMRTLSNAVFLIFTPALMFRTTAEIDLDTLPWIALAAFFGPAVALMVGTYYLGRRRASEGDAPGRPAVRGISVTFGNTLQVGLPVIVALYGQEGLRLHITLLSVHALTLLTIATALIEFDLARSARAGEGDGPSPVRTVLTTAKNTVIHPIVLPVILGLACNIAGVTLPRAVDETLQTMSLPVVPLCLVLIGVSLAMTGSREAVRTATLISIAKILLMPAIVLVVAHVGFGLDGLALRVVVLAAALPVGSNALLFAQRYETAEGETSTAIVTSTAAYTLTLPAWVAVLSAVG